MIRVAAAGGGICRSCTLHLAAGTIVGSPDLGAETSRSERESAVSHEAPGNHK
jgi:hypothetical protein